MRQRQGISIPGRYSNRPGFLADYLPTVMDFSEVLEKFGIEAPAHLDLVFSYHDPCHLARVRRSRSCPITTGCVS